MTVPVPVQGFPGGKPKEKGEGGGGPSDASGVRVNLTVHTSMFRCDSEHASEDEDEEYGSSAVLGSDSGAPRVSG